MLLIGVSAIWIELSKEGRNLIYFLLRRRGAFPCVLHRRGVASLYAEACQEMGETERLIAVRDAS